MGFVNAEAARKRRPWFQGLNPCSEILLDDRGVCNLCEINLMSFYLSEKNDIDYNLLVETVKLSVRVGLRQTNITLDLPEWDKIQKRDRLTGIGLSGVVDLDDALGWNKLKDSDDETGWEFDALSMNMCSLLQELNEIANQEAILYASEMRVPTPLLVTTVKPSGTISKLPGISPGGHRSRAPYYIRRVRITSTDPLARVMLNLGLPVYPENNSDGPTVAEFDRMANYEKIQVLQKANTWVIEFPVKTAAKVESKEEPAIIQFERYLKLQQYWTDHNTSVTIEFGEDEIEELVDSILLHWNEYIAISFMPKKEFTYPLLPEEPITKEEYDHRAASLTHITDTKILELLTEYEREDMATELLDADCEGGYCPVR